MPLTFAGEALYVEVAVLHTQRLTLARLPTSKAPDDTLPPGGTRLGAVQVMEPCTGGRNTGISCVFDKGFICL